MRILCITNLYPPYFEGGYEISVKDNMDYLSRQGHDIYILTGNRRSSDLQDAPVSAIITRPLRALHFIDYQHPGMRNKHRVEKHNYALTLSALDLVTPDLVYFGNQKGISLASVFAVQNQGYPKVFDIGDFWPDSYIGTGLKSRAYRWLKRQLPFTVGGRLDLDPVIAVSDWMIQELSKRYQSRHIYHIPRGVALPIQQIGPIHKPLRFVFAGRIEVNKGLELCIKAAHQVRDLHPDFGLDVYGDVDPDYIDHLNAQIENLRLGNNIRFRGKYHDVSTILPDYDVLLMPTLAREAFGRIIIEAMSYGLIVIATDAYGPKEIIDSGINGFLVQASSVSALASAILKLYELREDEFNAIRDKARNTVANKYEINKLRATMETTLINISNEYYHSQRG